MLKHFQELKAQMNKVREAERDKLTKVTLESNSAIKEVKRQNDKVSAKRILFLMNMVNISNFCDKFIFELLPLDHKILDLSVLFCSSTKITKFELLFCYYGFFFTPHLKILNYSLPPQVKLESPYIALGNK